MSVINDNDEDNDDRTDLRGLSPWLRAARVKRTAEIASLMVIVSGTVTQSQRVLRVLISVLYSYQVTHTSPIKAVTVKMFEFEHFQWK